MICINVQDLTYRFENGDTLFSELSFILNDKVTGLVGRNGSGKSVLAALLARDKMPYTGSVTQFCHVGWLRQLGPDNFFFQHNTISDFLGVTNKLHALARITEGGCNLQDFELIGDNWLLRECIDKQLESLGLPPDPWLPCQALSGGQLTRLALYQLFHSDYDYIILDEPSNHLDKKGKEGLIEEIQRFSGGILAISHDRELLQYVDDILELNSLGVRHYGGPYGVYAEQRTNELASIERRIEHVKSQRRKINKRMQKNREKTQQRANQGKLLTRSGSQAKILLNNKKQDAERSAGKGESRQNRQLVQIHDQLCLLNKQHEILKQQSLSLEPSEKRVSRILDVIGVHLAYIDREADLTFSVDFGDKIHISGVNGCGKSTLLKTIAGHLNPVRGEVQIHTKLCYLDQNFTLFDNTKTVQKNLEISCPHLSETEQRTLLAGIGLRREQVNQVITTLSGGEKMKVAMLVINRQPGNTLLLLDEPNNHLDIDSKLMLAQALHDFTGSLLVVSHDPSFITDIGISREICLDI
ncbi:MAG: ATP-binding cassette domain-containing protein [Yersinia sp. (in: enterobacteria)]